MPSRKKRQIAFMTRKNKSDARIVSSLIESQSWFNNWRLAPIDNLPQDQVAEIMRQSFLFFSFGHPEGFGLPVAESSACGCAVIGYTGNGAREIFDNFHDKHTAAIVSLNDWSGFLNAARLFIHNFESDPTNCANRLLSVSRNIQDFYSDDRMKASVVEALTNWSQSL